MVFRRQRSHRLCLIKPYKPIKLLRQGRLRIMAMELRLGAVDHPDEALKAWLE